MNAQLLEQAKDEISSEEHGKPWNMLIGQQQWAEIDRVAHRYHELMVATKEPELVVCSHCSHWINADLKDCPFCNEK